MTNRMHALLYPAAIGLLAGPGLAQGPQQATAKATADRVVRVVDIGALTRQVLSPSDCLAGSHIQLHGEGDSDASPFPDSEGARVLLQPDALIEVIRSWNPAAWEQPGAMLHFRPPGKLLVVNQGPDVERATTLIEDLQAILGRRCSLDATLYSLEEACDLPAVLTAAQLAPIEQGLRSGQVPGGRNCRLIWSGQGEGIAGEGVSLGITRTRQIVTDYGVEVAQKAQIADPVVGRVIEGIGVRAVPQFTSDGQRVALYVFGSVAWPARIETANHGNPGVGAIDRPVLDQVQVQSSAVLESGGAIAMQLGGRLDAGGAPILLLLKARFDPAPKPRDKDLAVWPAGTLLARHLIGRPYWFGMHALAMGGLRPTQHEDQPDKKNQQESMPMQDAGDLINLIREASPEDWQDGGQSQLVVHAGALLARNQPPAVERAGALLRTLEADAVQPYLFEVTLLGIADKHLPADGALLRGGASEGKDLAALAQGAITLDRARVATLPGRDAWFLRGRESTHVADYEVEIAQEASQADPVVYRNFAGITGRVRVLGVGERPTADMEVIVSGVEVTRRTLEEKKLGVLDLATAPRAMFRGCRAFAGKAPVLLGEGPPVRIGDETYRTVVQAALIRL